MKILLSFIVLLFTASADDSFDNFMQEMKNKSALAKQKSSDTEAEAMRLKYNVPSVQKVTDKNKAMYKALAQQSEKISQKAIDAIVNKKTEKALKEHGVDTTKKNEQVDTIFYLYSMSQSEYMLFNFMQEVTKLNAVNDNLKYYGVVQGLLSKEELKKLYTPFKYHKELEEKVVVKMQPFIFRDLNLKRVPAYLFSTCPSLEFKYKECKNKYLIRGEISLCFRERR